MATATDYLPEAVGGYLRLPREFADNRPVDRGKSSLLLLIDQLDLLAATMDQVFDAVCREDAAALVAHGRFLEEKFGAASTRRCARRRLRAPLRPCRRQPTMPEGPDTGELRLRRPPDVTPDGRRPIRSALDAHAGRGRRRLRQWPRPPGWTRRSRAPRALSLAAPWPSPRPRPRPTGRGAPAGTTPPRTSSTPRAGDAGGAARPRRPLSSLAAQGSPHARSTPGLAEVASAACKLGEPTMRVIGNASVAAAAQLGAVPDRPRCPPVVEAAARPAPPSPAASRPQSPSPRSRSDRERSLEELLAELDALIGLGRVKREVHRQVALLRVERLRGEAGLKSPTITRHLVFTGNPGTGKTTVADSSAASTRAGAALKGQLVEVDRSELVAGYLGPDGDQDGRGGRLGRGWGALHRRGLQPDRDAPGDQYGHEAVDTLVKEMEDRRDDLVVIVAGYPARWGFIARTPVWPAGSGPPSSSRTTPTTSSWRSSSSWPRAPTTRSPRGAERFRETLGAHSPRGELRQRAICPQRAGVRDRAPCLAAAGDDAATRDELRQLVARDFDEDRHEEEARGHRRPGGDDAQDPET